MKPTVAAAAALVLAMAATTASAGVVISQQLEQSNQPGQKTDQTVMIQGHKQKVINDDRTIITDLDAGTMYLIAPNNKQYIPIPLPPVGSFAKMTARQGLTEAGLGFKKTGNTEKLAGYTCEDYTTVVPAAPIILKVTQCMASDAPGAKEYAEFQKATADKLKLKGKGDIPDGIPVSTVTIRAVLPFRPIPGTPPEAVAKINAMMAKNKPFIRTTTVTKIEVKDLPADTFVVPADYTKNKMPEPKPMLGQHFVNPTNPTGAAPGASMDHGAPAAQASPASH